MSHALPSPRRFTPAEEFLAIAPEALSAEHVVVVGGEGWDKAKLFTLDTETGIAEVSVVGPLDARALWMWDGYGGSTGVEARVKAALADARTKAVVLRFDSPGGVVAGLFECVDGLLAAKASSGKPVVGLAEGSGAYSAAYALSTICDELQLSRTAGVGSIGVIATAASFAEKLAKDGIAVAVVASGSQKTDLHPALPLNEAAVKRLRTRVMDLAGLFAAEVARARGVSAEDVLALQAGIFHGEAALSAGLADRVGSLATAKQRAIELANARAKKAAQEKHMGALKAAIGLAEDASDEQVEQRAKALASIEKDLLAATGEKTADEAVAAVRANKLTASRFEAVSNELAALKSRSDDDEGARLLADARKSGKVTPADEADEDWKAMHTLAKASGMPALRAFFRTLKPRVSTAEVRPAADVSTVVMTDDDKHFARKAGLTDEEFLAQKRADLAAQKEGSR
jgi:ClpP class serine protease